MRDLAILFVHFLVVICRLARPGGIRSVIAESWQTIIVHKRYQTSSDTTLSEKAASRREPPIAVPSMLVFSPFSVRDNYSANATWNADNHVPINCVNPANGSSGVSACSR
jgi:hypothetical protein